MLNLVLQWLQWDVVDGEHMQLVPEGLLFQSIMDIYGL